MNKWQSIIILAVAICSGSAYWYQKTTTPHLPALVVTKLPVTKVTDPDDSELSEPIKVAAPDAPAIVVMHMAELPRVTLEPGMTQPPRPDAEPGRGLRMPYADEEEILGLDRNPIARIVDPNPARPNLFDQLVNPTDESEPADDYTCPLQGSCGAAAHYVVRGQK